MLQVLIEELLEIALTRLKSEAIIPQELSVNIRVQKHRQVDGQWLSQLAISMASQLNCSAQAFGSALLQALPQHALIESVRLTEGAVLVFNVSFFEIGRELAAIKGSFSLAKLGFLTQSQLSHPLYPPLIRTCGILDAVLEQKLLWDRKQGAAFIGTLQTKEDRKLLIVLYEAWQTRRDSAYLDKAFYRLLAKCVQNYYNAVALLALPQTIRDARLCLLEVMAMILYECLLETTRFAEN